MFGLIIRKSKVLTANIIKNYRQGLSYSKNYRQSLSYSKTIGKVYRIRKTIGRVYRPLPKFFSGISQKKALRISLKAFIKVVLSGIEPPTQGFSVLCSTN